MLNNDVWHSDDIVEAAWENSTCKLIVLKNNSADSRAFYSSRCTRSDLGKRPFIFRLHRADGHSVQKHANQSDPAQFGFDGSDIWISRRDTLLAALHANPKAKFVTRVLQFGSEPLYDDVLPHAELAAQVLAAKQNLSSLHIPVTVSELAYGYQERGGAQDVLDAIDSINIHMLPFFSQQASTCELSARAHTAALGVC